MVQATSRQFYVNLLHGCYGWDVYGIPPQPSLSIRSYKDRAHVCVFVFNVRPPTEPLRGHVCARVLIREVALSGLSASCRARTSG